MRYSANSSVHRMPTASSRPIDVLKKAANLERVKKTVVLNDGTEFELWHTPLTAAERKRARKAARSEDAGEIALQMLIEKALDENGQRMFSAGDAADLNNAVRQEDLQKLMLAVMDVEEEIDPKS